MTKATTERNISQAVGPRQVNAREVEEGKEEVGDVAGLLAGRNGDENQGDQRGYKSGCLK